MITTHSRQFTKISYKIVVRITNGTFVTMLPPQSLSNVSIGRFQDQGHPQTHLTLHSWSNSNNALYFYSISKMTYPERLQIPPIGITVNKSSNAANL